MIRKIFQTIADGMAATSMIAIVVLVALNGFEIFSRFLFQRSIFWIQDVTTLLMVWFVFPGMVKVIWEKRDILVDLLYKYLPGRAQKAVQALVYIIVIIFTAAMSYSTFRYLKLVLRAKSITAHIPMYLFTGVILTGFIMFLSIYIYDLVILLAGRENQKAHEGRST